MEIVIKLTREKLIANLVYLLASAVVSFCIIYTFDIHHNLYSWPTFPLTHIFQTPAAYVMGVPTGAAIGFVLTKVLIWAVKKDLGAGE